MATGRGTELSRRTLPRGLWVPPPLTVRNDEPVKLARDSTLAVRGDRSRLREVLETTGIPAALGTDRDGWQSVRLPASVDPGPLAAELSTALGTAVLGAEVDRDREALTLTAWRNGTEEARVDGHPGSAAAAARLAAALGRPHLAEELARSVRDAAQPARDRVMAAAAVLGLPDGVLADREPARSVAVYRGDPHAAERTAATLGGACIVDADGWSLLVPARPDLTTVGLAAGLSRSRGGRIGRCGCGRTATTAATCCCSAAVRRTSTDGRPDGSS